MIKNLRIFTAVYTSSVKGGGVILTLDDEATTNIT
jgi:hypothetical protein